jgi:RNA polymerase sigma-70 factor (ECF subfamily)
VRDFIRTYIPDKVSAEIAAQTVLLSVHRARHSYRQEQPFEPWLFAIVRKVVADFRRGRGRDPGPEGPLQNEEKQAHHVSGKGLKLDDPKRRIPLMEEGGVNAP